jgi:Domain of unknown function (DUF4326)
MPERVKIQGDLFHPVIPGGAIYVGRQCPGLKRSDFANPFKAGHAYLEPAKPLCVPPLPGSKPDLIGSDVVREIGGEKWVYEVAEVTSRARAVALFIAWADYQREDGTGLTYRQMCRRDLATRSLACWCPLDGEPCHADALLQWAAGWRASTPDVPNPGGGSTIHLKRACNGCHQLIGDVSWEEMEAGMNGEPLPDVRSECPRCCKEMTDA